MAKETSTQKIVINVIGGAVLLILAGGAAFATTTTSKLTVLDAVTTAQGASIRSIRTNTKDSFADVAKTALRRSEKLDEKIEKMNNMLIFLAREAGYAPEGLTPSRGAK